MTIAIDGLIKPTSIWLTDKGLSLADLTTEYLGLSITVSYRVKLGVYTVAEQEVVDVDGNGEFNLILPAKDDIIDEYVTLEIRAPSGEILATLKGDVDTFKPAPAGGSDPADVYELELDPVEPEEIIAKTARPPKISFKGRVLDKHGRCATAGLQVVIWATPVSSDEEELTEIGEGSYKPIFAGTTDADGYFFGHYKPKRFGHVLAVISGDTEQAYEINFKTSGGYSTLETPIIIFVDAEKIKEDDQTDVEDCGCDGAMIPLADPDQIAENPENFAQDLGGTCVNFTMPDRTVEEHIFYKVIRTVDQRIKGISLNSKDIRKIQGSLRAATDDLCKHVDRFVEWKDDLTLVEAAMVADIDPPRDPNEGSGQTSPIGGHSASDAPNGDLDIEDAGPGNIGETGPSVPDDSSAGPAEHDRVGRIGRDAIGDLAKAPVSARQRRFDVPPAESRAANTTQREQMAETLRLISSRTTYAVLGQFATDELFVPVTTASEPVRPASETGRLRPGLVQREQLERRMKKLSERVDKIRKRKRTIKKAVDEKLSNDITRWNLSDVLKCQESFKTIEELMDQLITAADDYRNMLTSHREAYMSADINFLNTFEGTEQILKGHIRRIKLHLEDIERAYAMAYPGRNHVSIENPIHWDEDVQLYHNTTIGHGHLLCYKQAWKSAGYSIGQLLNSMPLAPRQKKQIAVFSWDRSESASRSEIQTNEERLQSEMNRDRGITEIMNTAFKESIRASSSASTEGKTSVVGGGIGFAYGPIVLGVAGGSAKSTGKASSRSSQDAARSFAANSSNQLSDNIKQAASSLRSQRSTVVQTVDQAESFGVTTEVIANHNVCHAITIQHFEVLRHLVVEQCLAEVTECLFVPMDMSPFTIDKVMRWKHHLFHALISRNLFSGFDALERIATNYQGSSFKEIDARFADESIEHFTGDLQISFEFERPFIEAIEAGGNQTTYVQHYVETYKTFYGWTSLAFRTRLAKRFIPHSEETKDKIFEEEYAADIARQFIDSLQIHAEGPNGNSENLQLDITMVGKYKKGRPIYVRLSSSGDTPRYIRRADIERLVITSPTSVEGMSKILLHGIRLNYQNEHQSGQIINQRNVMNDVVNDDNAIFYTPLSSREKIKPKERDSILATRLLEHLNEYIEYYHKQIWMNMDPCRLFGLLDGFIAPNSQGRSVASVVENQVIGVISNNLILKVSPGFNLDPNYKVGEGFSLLDHYMPLTPPKPYRISLPTQGTYTESVMGACNSCEHIDESRFWRVNEMPLDDPTGINPIDTGSRRADPGDLQPKAMEAPIINIQNAPAAPDPTGLGAAIGLMGTSGIFENMTGLEGNQANALGALQSSAQSVKDAIQASQSFASMGLEARKMQLADSNRNNRKDLREIDRLEEEGKITPEQAQERRLNVLDRKDKGGTGLGGGSGSGSGDGSGGSGSSSGSGSSGSGGAKAPATVNAGVDALGKGAKKVSVKETSPDGSSTEVEMERDENAPFTEETKPTSHRADYLKMTSLNEGKTKFGMGHHHQVRRSLADPIIANMYAEQFATNILNQGLTTKEKNLLKTLPKIKDTLQLKDLSESTTIAINDAKKIHYFVAIHEAFSDDVHWKPPFLSWHRKFLKDFEKTLGMPLPYWNWYQSDGNIPQALELVNLKSLEPDYFTNLQRIRGDKDFDRLDVESHWSSVISRVESAVDLGGSFDWWRMFQYEWEVIHGDVHVYVGGHMGDISVSPFDPLFWGHHCFVDKFWADMWNVLEDDEKVKFNESYPTGPLPGPYEDTTYADVIETHDLMYDYEGLFTKKTDL